MSVTYTNGGIDQSAVLSGSIQISDGTLDLDAGPVQALLGSTGTLKEVTRITLNGKPGMQLHGDTASSGSDVLFVSDGGVVAWVDNPIHDASSGTHLHFGTTATQQQQHPFNYVFKASGTDSPPVNFTYTLKANGIELYRQFVQKKVTIRIPEFQRGASCEQKSGLVCLDVPLGGSCSVSSATLNDHVYRYGVRRDFYQDGDHCFRYFIRVSSTNQRWPTLRGWEGGVTCTGEDKECGNCSGEYHGVAVLNGTCDARRDWTQSITGIGTAEANPKATFSVGYAAAGGTIGSGLADAIRPEIAFYSWHLTGCTAGGASVACGDLISSVTNDMLAVGTNYSRSVSTSKNGSTTLSSAQGTVHFDTLSFSTENDDVRHSVEVTFNGVVYRDVNGDGFVDAGPFSAWVGGNTHEDLFATFDRSGIPVAAITTIMPNPSLWGDYVQFAGQGFGAFTDYEWFTHRQDQQPIPRIGTTATFTRNDMAAGLHNISLEVSGSGIKSPRTYRTLIVNQAPIAFINAIVNANHPQYPSVAVVLHDGAPADPFIFDGGGVDADGSIAEYVWTSDREPGLLIGTAANFRKSLTALGKHTITLRVRDNSGIWSAPVKRTVTVRYLPVLLIHGLCGGRWTWDALVNDDLLGPGWTGGEVVRRTFDPDGDGDTNDSPAAISQLIWQEIQRMKWTYSVPGVNIVGHSMGGLSSRAYVQGPAYQGDVNKLVMLATPNRGATLADIALYTLGYSQADIELLIPDYRVRALLRVLGEILDVINAIDPDNPLACTSEDSAALHALRPHSDFLRGLNGNAKDDGTEDFGPSGEPPDRIPAVTQYFTIQGTNRVTVSHLHPPNLLVEAIASATGISLKGWSVLWARNGDRVVTSPSVRLDGVPGEGLDQGHIRIAEDKKALDQAAFYLHDDPPQPPPPPPTLQEMLTAYPVGARSSSLRSDRLEAPATFELDAAARRLRVTLEWSRGEHPVTAARQQQTPPVLVLTSPSGVRYASNTAVTGYSVNFNSSGLEAVIENPSAGTWQLAVLPPADASSSRINVVAQKERQPPVGTIIPYSWIALEESATFMAAGASAETIEPGAPVTIAAYLQRDGAGVSGAVMHAAISNGTQKTALTLVHDDRFPGLYTTTYTPAASGTYRVIASATFPASSGAPISRVALLNFESRFLPDLTIRLIPIPDAARMGDPVQLTATVTNRGKAPATSVEVRFFDGMPADNGRFLGERIVTVPPSGTATVSLPWRANAGVHTLVAIVDPANISGELDASDNVAPYVLTVRDVRPPIARAGADQVAMVGRNVVFDGRASTDDDRIASYTWTDVSPTRPTAATMRTSSRLEGGYAVHTGGFTTPGTRTIRLTVTDSSGNSATDDLVVRVVNEFDTESPVANAGANITATVGAPVKFDGSGSRDDYGIAVATWDVDVTTDSDGDGNPSNDQDLAGLLPTLTEGYAKPGVHRARLTVRDAVHNGAPSAEVIVTVLPRPEIDSSKHETEKR